MSMRLHTKEKVTATNTSDTTPYTTRRVRDGRARAGGAWVNGLGRGMCATTGCAKPQADHGADGARRGLKLDRG